MPTIYTSMPQETLLNELIITLLKYIHWNSLTERKATAYNTAYNVESEFYKVV